MAQKKHVHQLEYYLWRQGPYIIFFNACRTGFNEEIVKNMNELATQYPALNVFEIDWEKKKTCTQGLKDEVMNTVYIYSDGKIKEEYFCPDKDKINELFKIAIVQYNQNLEIRARNVGNRKKRFDKNISISSVEKLNDSEKKKIENKKKYILKRKIKYNNESILPLENEEKFHSLKMKTKDKIPEKDNNDFNKNYEEVEQFKQCCLKPDLTNTKMHFAKVQNYDDKSLLYLPKKIQRQRENLKRISSLSNLESIKQPTKNTEHKSNNFIVNNDIQHRIQRVEFPKIKNSRNQEFRKNLYSMDEFYKL